MRNIFLNIDVCLNAHMAILTTWCFETNIYVSDMIFINMK